MIFVLRNQTGHLVVVFFIIFVLVLSLFVRPAERPAGGPSTQQTLTSDLVVYSRSVGRHHSRGFGLTSLQDRWMMIYIVLGIDGFMLYVVLCYECTIRCLQHAVQTLI